MAWMRQKPGPTDRPADPPATAATSAGSTIARENEEMEKIVNIGKSIQIKGELTGNEDLTIDGRVDGKITLKDHNLTVGANGHITAEIHAKSVVVVGEVTGNVTADDRVEVGATGSMNGDICAPRVVLADGARFKGSIDMEPKSLPVGKTVAPAIASSGAASSSSSGASQRPSGDMPRSASAKA